MTVRRGTTDERRNARHDRSGSKKATSVAWRFVEGAYPEVGSRLPSVPVALGSGGPLASAPPALIVAAITLTGLSSLAALLSLVVLPVLLAAPAPPPTVALLTVLPSAGFSVLPAPLPVLLVTLASLTLLLLFVAPAAEPRLALALPLLSVL